MIRLQLHSSIVALNVPSIAQDAIESSLTIPNPEWNKRHKERLPIYGVDQYIQMWDAAGEDMDYIFPRGILPRLLKGFSKLNLKYSIEDNMVMASAKFTKSDDVVLRDYQIEAVNKMGEAQGGIYKAPPGAGKTFVTCGVIDKLQQKSVIIVDRLNIAEQWLNSITAYFDNPKVVVNEFEEEADICIALQQSLWSQRYELFQSDWFDRWGIVVLDEAHHSPAETYFDILSRFPGRYRYGVTATPGKKDGYLQIAKAVLGPIVYETTKDELRSRGILGVTQIKPIRTQFEFDYRPTQADPITGRFKRNNYSGMLKSLVEDRTRNDCIAEHIKREFQDGHCNLVNSKQIRHLEQINEALQRTNIDPQFIFWLTGQQDLDERKAIYERAEKANCIILSTLGDEALDIPRLDRLFLTFPTSNMDGVLQQIGRIERLHKEKKDIVVYDFIDKPGPLKTQALKRQELYRREGYEYGR